MSADVTFVQAWLFRLAKLCLVPNLRRRSTSGHELLLYTSWSWGCSKCLISCWHHFRSHFYCMACGPPAGTLLWCHVLLQPLSPYLHFRGLKKLHCVLGGESLAALWERQVCVSITSRVWLVLCIWGGKSSWQLSGVWGRQEDGFFGKRWVLASVMKQRHLWSLELYFPPLLDLHA